MSDHTDPAVNPRWARWRQTVDLDEYDRRFDRLQASGESSHGEADAVDRLLPHGGSVLDAGCGTGRIAIELARRGFDVVGVDVDPEMLERAQRRRPELDWIIADLATLELDRTFDLVLLAGNVMVFVPDGAEAAVIAGGARHLNAGGLLVAGFSLGRAPAAGIGLDTYDEFARTAGLSLVHRWATWDGDQFDGGDYAVSTHQLRTETDGDSSAETRSA